MPTSTSCPCSRGLFGFGGALPLLPWLWCCRGGSCHLWLQHVSLQAGPVLLGAVGPADGQAVGLPLLLGLASSCTAHRLHGHPGRSHRLYPTWKLEMANVTQMAASFLSTETVWVPSAVINAPIAELLPQIKAFNQNLGWPKNSEASEGVSLRLNLYQGVKAHHYSCCVCGIHSTVMTPQTVPDLQPWHLQASVSGSCTEQRPALCRCHTWAARSFLCWHLSPENNRRATYNPPNYPVHVENEETTVAPCGTLREH